MAHCVINLDYLSAAQQFGAKLNKATIFFAEHDQLIRVLNHYRSIDCYQTLQHSNPQAAQRSILKKLCIKSFMMASTIKHRIFT